MSSRRPESFPPGQVGKKDQDSMSVWFYPVSHPWHAGSYREAGSTQLLLSHYWQQGSRGDVDVSLCSGTCPTGSPTLHQQILPSTHAPASLTHTAGVLPEQSAAQATGQGGKGVPNNRCFCSHFCRLGGAKSGCGPSSPPQGLPPRGL